MSTPQPPRRRRIAGESKPGAPAPRTSPKKKVTSRRPSKPAAPQTRPVKSPPSVPPPPPPPPPPPSTEPETTKAPLRFDMSAFRRFRFDMSVFRRSGRFGALTALAVAALLFGGWFGYQGWNDSRTDVVEAHEQAADTAASSAETIFTYQYDKLDEYVEDAQDTMTPSFGEKFKTIAPALNDLAPQRKIQVKASTRDAAALECGKTCSEDKATILVFVDQARLADDSDKPTVFGNRVELEMVNSNGTWLVSNIKAL